MTLSLPGYEIGEKLGEGGMATVYQGRQISLARDVAIKLLNPHMLAHAQVREAFERESLIIAKLNHPNIIQVIDRGVTADQRPFFVMEYIAGVDLALLLREGELPLQRKLDICLQIAKALAYAHKNGVVHRDIKPANVIVDHELHCKVLDFGIALFYRDNPDVDAGDTDVSGTLAYMAPEVSRSLGQATTASDIYSLGVMMFELLTGRLPSGRIVPPSHYTEGLAPELDRLVLTCLAPDPAKRVIKAEDIYERLLMLLRGDHLNRDQARRARASVNKKSFTLLDVLHESAYSAAYLFVETTSQRRLVVKKAVGLHQGYHAGRQLAGLDHPHLAKVHGVSKSERAFITVSDYLSGGSLQERLLNPFSVDDFLRLARQMCAGLTFAHRHRIIHGNLRASNVLFDSDGNLRLTDFGWPSHYADEPLDVDQQGSGNSSGKNSRAEHKHHLTKQNWYRLPDEPVSEQLDIYACGILFYQLLIGELPQWQGKVLQTGRAYKRLPKRLQQLLQQMLELDPQRRLQHVAQVRSVLDEFTDDMPTRIWNPRAVPAATSNRNKMWVLLLLPIAALVVGGLINFGVIGMPETITNLISAWVK